MDDLNEYRVFRAIAESGSLVRAGLALGIPRSTVSKRLADLEARLGQVVFKRTTRRVALTPVGKALYDQVIRGLDIIDRGASAVRDGAVREGKRIVVSAPPVLARSVLGNVAGELMRRGRRVTLELRSQVDYDAVRDADVDIRLSAHPTGRPPAGSRVAGRSRREIYATPSLVASFPSPVGLADVTPDKLIMRTPWEQLNLVQGRRKATLVCGGPILTEHHETVRDAVLGGTLFGVLPRFVAMPLVERGALVQVLGEWRFPDVPIAITVAPHARHCEIADEIAMQLPASLHQSGLFG